MLMAFIAAVEFSIIVSAAVSAAALFMLIKKSAEKQILKPEERGITVKPTDQYGSANCVYEDQKAAWERMTDFQKEQWKNKMEKYKIQFPNRRLMIGSAAAGYAAGLPVRIAEGTCVLL